MFVASPNVIGGKATAAVGKWILEEIWDLFPSWLQSDAETKSQHHTAESCSYHVS